MGYAELPEQTDAEKILAALDDLHSEVHRLNERLDAQANGLNSIGSNVNWLTENVQGVFAMFQSPMMLQQLSSMMGGIPNGSE